MSAWSRVCCLLVVCCLACGQAWAASRCSERKPSLLLMGKISCSYQSRWIDSGLVGQRKGIYQLPLGVPAGTRLAGGAGLPGLVLPAG